MAGQAAGGALWSGRWSVLLLKIPDTQRRVWQTSLEMVHVMSLKSEALCGAIAKLCTQTLLRITNHLAVFINLIYVSNEKTNYL